MISGDLKVIVSLSPGDSSKWIILNGTVVEAADESTTLPEDFREDRWFQSHCGHPALGGRELNKYSS
jgi:hypothetical protein